MTNEMSKAERIKAWALENYEKGGHWLYETYSIRDWESLLEDCNNNLAKAKSIARELWSIYNERESACRYE